MNSLAPGVVCLEHVGMMPPSNLVPLFPVHCTLSFVSQMNAYSSQRAAKAGREEG